MSALVCLYNIYIQAHTQFIYYFSFCIKSIYRYMYNNCNGSEIIYHMWQSSGNICRCLETDFDKSMFYLLLLFLLDVSESSSSSSPLLCCVVLKAAGGFRAPALFRFALDSVCNSVDSVASPRTSSLVCLSLPDDHTLGLFFFVGCFFLLLLFSERTL